MPKNIKLFITVFTTIHLVNPAWPAQVTLIISTLIDAMA